MPDEDTLQPVLPRSSKQGGGLMRSERKHGLSTEQVPVSAYGRSEKNLKDLKGGFSTDKFQCPADSSKNLQDLKGVGVLLLQPRQVSGYGGIGSSLKVLKVLKASLGP